MMIKVIAHKKGRKKAEESTFYKISCALGWREYVERFGKVENAHAFVMLVLGKDKPRWKSETLIVAKDADTLKIESDKLEEIMACEKKGSVDSIVAGKVHRFLFGVWKEEEGGSKESYTPKEGKAATLTEAKEKAAATRARRAAVDDGRGVITLDALCKRNKWEPKRVRQALRKLGEKKDGRWAWSSDEALEIEKRLRRVLE